MTAEPDRPARRVQERLQVLSEVSALADGRVPPDAVERAVATVQRASGRLGHSAAHTVVALAGATGSGKSSTFNALAGSEVATVGVRRPTTSTAQAAVFTSGQAVGADAAALLSWLGVDRHVVVHDPALDGLVLLDLPDHDSTEAAHRQEVDRLVEIVDVFVWVVDPQKYADAALHHGYLRRFAGHADVTVVVLNQIDTVPTAQRAAAIDDLARIVAADGLPVARPGVVAKVLGRDGGVRVMGASARTGEGIDALRREISARVSARRALVDRIDADIDWIADDLEHAVVADVPTAVPDRAAADLGDALAGAVGVAGISDAVAESHRRRGAQAAGWPPTRWISRLRPDPLRRLGLDRRGQDASRSGGPEAPVPRTSLPPPTPVAAAAASIAIRRLVEDTSAGMPDQWRARLATVAGSRRGDLDDALDRAVGTTRLRTDGPTWWRAAAVLQGALATAMAVGLLWLLAISVVAWLNLPDLPSVDVGELPLPTVLAVGGALGGLLLAAVARQATNVGARRRGAIARRQLVSSVTEVGRELVVRPLDEELAVLARLHALVRRLRE